MYIYKYLQGNSFVFVKHQILRNPSKRNVLTFRTRITSCTKQRNPKAKSLTKHDDCHLHLYCNQNENKKKQRKPQIPDTTSIFGVKDRLSTHYDRLPLLMFCCPLNND